MKFETDLSFGDRVLIDRDASLVAVVVAFWFQPAGHNVEVCWMHDGKNETAVMSAFRLTKQVSR